MRDKQCTKNMFEQLGRLIQLNAHSPQLNISIPYFDKRTKLLYTVKELQLKRVINYKLPLSPYKIYGTVFAC